MNDLSRDVLDNFYMSFGISKYNLVQAQYIPPLSPSLHYSSALFEGMSILGVPDGPDIRLGLFHPNLNLERMRHGMKSLKIDWELYSDEQIIESIFTICALNKWNKSITMEDRNVKISNEFGEYYRIYVRPLVFAKNNAIGLGARLDYELMLGLMPMGEYIAPRDPDGACVMLFPRPRELAFPTVKASSNYQLSMHARSALKSYNANNDIQCDEAIFNNPKGNITEGTGENIVMIKDNELITPPVSEGALPGITYRIAFLIAEELGLKTKFGTFAYSDVESADALFFTGNAAGLVPIKKVVRVDSNYSVVDYMETKEGGKNHIFAKLKQEYAKISMGDASYGSFFTYLSDWIDESRLDELNRLGDEFKHSLSKEMEHYEGTNTSISSYMHISPKISVIRKYFDDKRWIIERLGIKHYL